MHKPLLFLLATCTALMAAPKPMEVYFIDVEGGQATLIVSPSGQSMVIDTGWDGFNNRDADRIATAAAKSGVKQIDYLLITHYHADHVGGVPQLAARLPIKNFVDHGPNFEAGHAAADKLFSNYTAVRDKGNHLLVKPGDRVPIKGLSVEILTADGNVLTKALPGAGQPNPYCANTPKKADDTTENSHSTGSLIAYGKFRLLDLGDLTWNKEIELVCPNNRVGTVDVYLTTHHGLSASGSPAIVDAVHPRVAIMNNGATKGGAPEAWQVVHDVPGLEGLWQLHTAEGQGAHNTNPEMIANPDSKSDAGNYIKLTALPTGEFTVTNGRTGVSKTYAAK
ncbi:MAG TPA: MBL fold metallo-hydrolase [Bryobacteraceae bacterium]|jgi:beta-lactamase superfamily II metal-dependent hydrolase